MKRNLTINCLVAFVMLSFVPNMLSAQEMTKDERKYALDYLQSTKENFIKSIKGLSAAQWNFKADTSRWSVAECSEHIIVSEGFLMGHLQDSILSKPSNPEKKGEIKMKTEDIAKMIENRDKKFKTSEKLTPKGTYATPDDAIKAFGEARQKTIDFVKNTNADLHGHVIQGPMGYVDAYQWIIFLAAHNARHTKQIQEVETTASYPQK